MSDIRMCYGGIYFSRIAYVSKKHGKEGMKKLLEKMKEYGYDGPTDEKDIKLLKMYPMDYNIIFLKAYRDLFGENNFRRLSRESSKNKGIVGTVLKWENSPDKIIKDAGIYWNKFYNFGRLEGIMLSPNKAEIHGYDIYTDKIFCRYLTYYYRGIFDLLNLTNVIVEHTSCVGDGDDHCVWTLTWGDKDRVSSSQKDSLKWDSSLETGIDEIDRQHQYFIEILNEVNKSMHSNYKTSTIRLIHFMDHYAHWHFASEEKYMDMYDYPAKEEHKKEHRKFYDYTEKIHNRIEVAGIDEHTLHSINKYLIDWLINHIKGTDAAFARYLRAKNFEMQEEDMPKDLQKELEEAIGDVNEIVEK